MLSTYLLQTAQLLSNPAAPTTLYSTSDLTGYINTARTQLAGETGCVRAIGILVVTSASQYYNFSAIANLPTSVNGVYSIRQILRVSGSGQVYMGSRPYPWAVQYFLNNPTPVAAAPTEWSQYGIGDAGSLVLNTLPDANYTLNCDVTCTPIDLVTDSTPEAIPYAYQDAICYFAAYNAYMSAQRQADADKMLQRYSLFIARAKNIAVPSVLPMQYDQFQPAPQPQQGGGQ